MTTHLIVTFLYGEQRVNVSNPFRWAVKLRGGKRTPSSFMFPASPSLLLKTQPHIDKRGTVSLERL